MNLADFQTRPEHRMLPPSAVRMLQEAARTPVTAADPLARLKAIEMATAYLRAVYPTLFRPET
ncbi:MAG TPA: hypothetical protein VEA81_00215 [Burkholderiaceae bacterium]|nr:hypothetical protein [Burkholderiaceae bacterium]